MRRVISLISVAGLVFFAAACGSDSKGGSGAKTLEFTITDEGCNPAEASTTPGSTNFHVKNDGADNITEFEVLDSTNKIVGEKENLTPGLEGSFTIDLKDGNYTIACPGGTKNPTGKLTVSANGAAASESGMHHDEEGGDCVPAAPASGSAGATTEVKATLSDFKIELDPTSTKAGANPSTTPRAMPSRSRLRASWAGISSACAAGRGRAAARPPRRPGRDVPPPSTRQQAACRPPRMPAGPRRGRSPASGSGSSRGS